MARIRSLKPEHKRHRKIGPLTDFQYRLWIGMLTEADDEGRLVADISQLKLEVFGYHPKVSLERVAEALQAIADVGLVRVYTVGDTRYVQFPSWKDHQVINKAKPSNLPPPLHSLNSTGSVPDTDGPTTVGSDLIGSDRKGSERSIVGLPPDATPLNGYRHEAEMILAFLNDKAGRTFRPTRTNLALIEARLRAGASPDDCRGVIVRKVRAWGTDPKMAPYLRPATLFNQTKFDQYIGEQGRPS